MMICYSWLKKEVNVKIRKKNILKLLLAVTVFIFVSNIFIKLLNIVINKKNCSSFRISNRCKYLSSNNISFKNSKRQ